LWWLKRLAFAGQSAPDRVAAVRAHPGRDAGTQAAEVIGQRKLLKWSVPGAAHAATFWGMRRHQVLIESHPRRHRRRPAPRPLRHPLPR